MAETVVAGRQVPVPIRSQHLVQLFGAQALYRLITLQLQAKVDRRVEEGALRESELWIARDRNLAQRCLADLESHLCALISRQLLICVPAQINVAKQVILTALLLMQRDVTFLLVRVIEGAFGQVDEPGGMGRFLSLAGAVLAAGLLIETDVVVLL